MKSELHTPFWASTGCSSSMWKQSPTTSKSSQQNGHTNSVRESSSPPSISSDPKCASTVPQIHRIKILKIPNQRGNRSGKKQQNQRAVNPPPYRDCSADCRRLEAAKERLHESGSISPFHDWEWDETLEIEEARWGLGSVGRMRERSECGDASYQREGKGWGSSNRRRVARLVVKGCERCRCLV